MQLQQQLLHAKHVTFAVLSVLDLTEEIFKIFFYRYFY